MKKFVSVLVTLALCASSISCVKAQLFLSFFDVDNAAQDKITELTPFSESSKCFNVAMSLVEDGQTDVFDMTPEKADVVLSEFGIKPGVYRFRFGDGAKKKDKKLTFGATKQGLKRDNNKGKNKTLFAFKVKKNKKDGTLSISKRATKVVCATDETIAAGTPVTVSFSSASAKAVKQFGLLSTIFSLSVKSE